MQRIMAMIRAILASIRVVWEPVFRAGKWTVETVTRVVAPVIDAAEAAIDTVLSIPGKVFAGRPAAGPGQQAAATAQAAAQQVQSANAETSRALTMQQTVGLAQRVANARAKGRNIGEMAGNLPPNLAEYIKALGTTECERFAAADPRYVAEFIHGTRPRLEGIRNGDDLRGDQAPAKPHSPSSNDAIMPQEQVVLATLAARLKARGQRCP
jgi:hypothetical protein